MNKKRGFTLIELLAVIAILVVILSIAIPSITSMINSVKLQAFDESEQTMIKAAKSFIVVNRSYLPLNIGDTKEVKLSDLQQGKYIEVIKSPEDKNITCDGYVLIMKTNKDKYEYTPHLNCANSIGSLSEDDLIAHWKFDDFQEPTENIFPRSGQVLAFISAYNGTNYGFSSATNMQQVIDNSIRFDNRASVTKVSRINSDISQRDYVSVNLSSPLNSTRVVSFWYYGTYGTSISPYNNDASASLYYLDSDGNWIGGGTSISIPVPENQWYKVTIKIANRGVIAGTGWSWFILHNNQVTSILDNNQYWAFTLFSYEEKPYATEFVDGIRTGSIRDYSGNGYNPVLQQTTTPKWVENSKIGKGAYEFNGVNSYIPLPSNLSTIFNNSNFTLSAWIKSNGMASGMSLSGIINLGYGLSLSLNSTGNLAGRMDNGTSLPMWSTSGINLYDNEYHFVAMSFDGSYMRLYIDGSMKKEVATIWNNRYSNAGAIGYEANNPPLYRFLGLIDDVKLYSRALNTEEIKQIYDADEFKN